MRGKIITKFAVTPETFDRYICFRYICSFEKNREREGWSRILLFLLRFGFGEDRIDQVHASELSGSGWYVCPAAVD